MSGTANEAGSVGSNADAFPKPEPKLLRPHQFARHDLIPLNRPDAIRHGKPVGKAPLDVRWPKRDYSRSDPASWMARGHNVGVRLHDDQLVIDVDPRHFEGADRLARLCERFGIRLDDYPRVLSGGGGQHIYMAKPSELRIVGKLSEFPGIEFKTKGTLLVAAGSVHPDSHKHYRADDPFGDLADPPMAPASLLNAIERKKRQPIITGHARLASDQMSQLLAVLDPTKYRDHDEWLGLMMSCHHATSGDGMDEFVTWSIQDPNYASHGDKIRERWNSLDSSRGDGITAGTLFKAVIDAGHGDLVHAMTRTTAAQDFPVGPLDLASLDLKAGRNGVPAATLANCLAVLEHASLGFAFDELARRPLLRAECLPWVIDIGREVNDDVLRVIRHFLLVQVGIEFSKENVIEACLTLARQAPFNPVIDYLSSLKWDGTLRLDDWLVRYLGAEGNEYIRAVGRLVLTAAVRRARRPGCKFDYVMILEGAQGTGKSSALKVLGGEWHSDAELGRLDSKEAPLVLQSVWIHELGELTAMGRSEVEDLKAFVSRCEDRFRAPYDRVPRTEPRRCIFIGTTNAEAYLFDTTGNRRFWPVKTGRIDIDALRQDRDQLWAEAAAAETTGAPLVLAPHLWAVAAEEQADRLADDPWKDRLAAWLETPRVSTVEGVERTVRIGRVHTRELLSYALDIEAGRQTQHLAKRVRDVMRSIGGWKYKRSLRIEGQGIAAGYQRDEN